MRLGLFDGFRRQRTVALAESQLNSSGPKITSSPFVDDVTGTYSPRSVAYRGEVARMDYDKILRDTQNWHNYVQLCQLANYYVNKDPLFRGIIKEVYTPFTLADHWQLVGGDAKIKKKYTDFYDRIHLNDFLESLAYQYWLYGNVPVYLMPDGHPITLPFHLTRLGGVNVFGEPLVEYHCQAVQTEFDNIYKQALKMYVDDSELQTRLKGLPPEVIDGLQNRAEWVQLNPMYTYTLQDIKEGWLRYATPLVATCLSAFRKKELISKWEDSQLNLGSHSFLHVKYGSNKDGDSLPDTEALQMTGTSFAEAMRTSGLVVTDPLAEPEFHQPDLDELFSDDKYKSVNSDILDAGGISGIIVSGRAEDGSTFASAQVSMQTAALRIQRAKDKICEMMDAINRRINMIIPSFPHSNEDRIPKFRFPPTDLTGETKFLKTCDSLYAKGLLSNETYVIAHGFDFDQEVRRKTEERKNGIAELFTPYTGETTSADESAVVQVNRNAADTSTERGRPTLDDDERHSDPAKSVTGRQPKGSNPEGSEAQADSN